MYGLNHLVYLKSSSSQDLADLKHRIVEGINKAPSDDLRPPHCIPESVIRRGALARWIHREGGSSICRCLSISEVEAGMGYPPNATAVPPSVSPAEPEEALWLRHSLIGNSFALQSACYVLQPLSAVFLDSGDLPPPRDLTSLASSNSEALAVVRTASAVPWYLPSNEGR